MARGNDPNSAKSEFFINLKDNTVLDTTEEKWGWAVFGKVIAGIDVVDQLAGVPTRTRGTREDIPVDPISIERAYMTTLEAWQEATGQDTTTTGQ
jgi:peptidyl-prolyl cis-trans isomerase A (cyclophilin A)